MDKIVIHDIETLKRIFLVVCLVPGEPMQKFEVSEWKNDLDRFVKFTETHRDYYWVGYNNLRFDSQVIEWILQNCRKWYDLSGSEICQKIWQKAQDVISDANYDVFPEYREIDLTLKQIDLFKVAHYDNKMRRVSLKRLEFEMDMENIEEIPIAHDKDILSREEAVQIITYCCNDVNATYQFYLIIIGETDHPLYKGNNQIELRQDIEEEFGIKCLNYSNAKIGDEIIKKFYCEEKGIKYAELPKKGTFRKEIALKHCIPSYIKFRTPQLQEFLKRIKTLTLKQNEDFVESIRFKGQEYTFAKGGLHNVINGKMYESSEQEDIEDVDVSGYYPATIINNSYYPYHLGKAFLTGYSKVYFKRIELKPQAKTDRRIKGIVGGLKEAGNCPYGKSSDMTSWLYDKQMTLATCLTGELTLLMMIEAMELEGIRCIMANTDGATFIVPKTKRETFDVIKEWWLKATTKHLTFELEQVSFRKIIFSTVNDYIAIKTNGEVKIKGDFMKDFELHKNKSARVVPIALYEYYVNNIPVEQTIKNYPNIYDFCLRQKASRDFHYEGHREGNITVYDKLIRYYVSHTGEKLYKIKNPECTTNAVQSSQVEAGEWLMKVCNHLPRTTKVKDCDINFDYYIERANKIIHKITSGGKKYKAPCKQQLTLW